jgi:hemerythrin
MAIFEWQDRYLIGVEQIDEHHKHLIELLNKTHRDFLCQAPPAILAGLFEELIDYATYHFSAEEEVMLESGFPNIDRHKQEHDQFARDVVTMHSNYLEKQKPFFLEILTFLYDWLKSHIPQSDNELGRFLAKKNK